MAGRRKISKRKGAVKISPLVLFLIWGGLLMGLVAVLILLQNGSLNRQLVAGLPSGSPSASPSGAGSLSACYYDNNGQPGCAKGTADHTATDCDKAKGGSKHYYYFIKDRQCLKTEEAKFNGFAQWGDNCGVLGNIQPTRDKCLLNLKAAIDKDPCPAGTKQEWEGGPRSVYEKVDRSGGVLGIPTINATCDVTCTAVRRCVKPVESQAISNFYVSLGDPVEVSEGGGFGKAYFEIRVHDINNNSVSNHGGVTVKYHTEEISGGDLFSDPAQEGVDYEGVNSSATILAGSSRQAIAVTILRDDQPENRESFWMVLDSATGASLGLPRRLGTIIDDDSQASVAPSP